MTTTTRPRTSLPTIPLPALDRRPSFRGRRRRRLAAALLLAGLAVGSAACGSAPTSIAADAAQAPTSAGDAANSTPVVSTPAGDGPVEVLRPVAPIDLHQEPSLESASRTLATTTDFGSPTALLILERSGQWAKVLVPGRPTGATAWVATDGVPFRTVELEIRVDLGARTLTLLDGDATVLTTPVAVGSAEFPTPTGRFSVTDKLRTGEDGGAYGPYAVGLSARSEVLTEFAGGDGQIGIHGTNDPSSIGQAVSHGCVRVPNEVIEQLNELLPLGTPVVVS